MARFPLVPTAPEPERAILVGVEWRDNAWPLDRSLDELERLAHTAGAGLELVDADDIGILGLDQVDVLVDDEVDLVGLVRHFERQHVPVQYFQLYGLRLRRSRRKEQAA